MYRKMLLTEITRWHSRSWKSVGIALALLAMAILSGGSAHAQIPREWAQCIGREGPIPEVIIRGCSAIIEARQEEPRKMATAFNNRGVAHRFKRDYDAALADYSEALRLNPSSASAYNNRGIIFRIRHDYDRAIADYDHAIALNPDYTAAFYNRALAYTDKSDYGRAAGDFDVVLKVNPNNALARYARGLMLLKKGDTDAGNRDISTAKAIDPAVAEQYDASD
jgi:tetratricopeptide (TPR) repeat protein